MGCIPVTRCEGEGRCVGEKLIANVEGDRDIRCGLGFENQRVGVGDAAFCDSGIAVGLGQGNAGSGDRRLGQIDKQVEWRCRPVPRSILDANFEVASTC